MKREGEQFKNGDRSLSWPGRAAVGRPNNWWKRSAAVVARAEGTQRRPERASAKDSEPVVEAAGVADADEKCQGGQLRLKKKARAAVGRPSLW